MSPLALRCSTLWVIGALILPLKAAWTQQRFVFSKVALTGEHAAGTPSGVTYALDLNRAPYFNYLAPSLNATGQVTFYSDLTGYGVSVENGAGLWSGAPGDVALVARSGDQAPGLGAGVNYTGFGEPATNAAGQSAFLASTTASFYGLWSGYPGAVAFVARQGTLGTARINAVGQSAFPASINNKFSILVGAPGSVAILAREGDHAPGMPSAVNYGNFFRTAYTINAAGQTMFSCDLVCSDPSDPSCSQEVTNENNVGLWSGAPGSVSLLARKGSPAPGTAAGVNYDLLGYSVINSAGQVTFLSSVSGPGVTSNNNIGFWFGTPGHVELLARTGEPTPGAPAGAVYTGFVTLPAVNAAGQSAFIGSVSRPAGTYATGIWLGKPGAVTKVFYAGEAAPGAGSGTVFEDFPSLDSGAHGPVALNDRNELVFLTRLGGPTVNDSNDGSLWFKDAAGTLSLVVREGDSIEIAPGDTRIVSGIYFQGGSADEDGFPCGFNDLGQITFLAHFTDNSEAIFIATPAPTSAPLVLIPGIAASVLKGTGDNGFEELWPTVSPTDIGSLSLNGGARDVVAVDVLRRVFGIPYLKDFDVYDSLIKHLTSRNGGYTEFDLASDPLRMTQGFTVAANDQIQASGITPNFFTFPYDWRFSNSSHIDELHQYIQNIRNLHGGTKVDVIAHSAGGLLLRSYILKYGSDDISHAVTVGTPWWGAPRVLYRMLSGNFFEVLGGLVDFFNRAEVRKTLPTFPGAHELFPSDLYLAQNGGLPVMRELNYDVNMDGVIPEDYSPVQYKAFIDQAAKPFIDPTGGYGLPAANNEYFHSIPEDNWSGDASAIKYLHICGKQKANRTTLQVTAQYETILGYVLSNRPIFDQLPGEGDGVVPLLSAQRQPDSQKPDQFLAPNTLTRVISGNKNDVEHTGLMHHSTVWSMIDAFLKGQPVPNAAPPEAARASTAATAVTTQRITIVGNGYVQLKDSLGNENTKLSDIAAAKIPGLDVTYGGDNPWVDIYASSDVDFTIQGGESDQVIEAKVIQLAEDATPLSLRRYRFDAIGHSWQMHISPADAASTEPVVSVDTNDNGMYDDGEQIVPSNSSGTGFVDNTAPTLDASYFDAAGSVVVQLTAHDDVTTNPEIRYTINDGAVQDYEKPLSFPADGSAILKAFAEDAMGNTSALLTTTVPSPGPIPTATPGLVGNVSTRLPVGTGDDALIGGFIVQGPAGSTKKIMVRAVGPSLAGFGITDALANPTLEIHDSSSATVATNNDWKNTQLGGLITADQTAEISTSGVAPSNDLESATIVNLAPGSYTAVVRGFGNSTGTGVVDAYDLSGSSPARLANIATRGLVQAGDKLMIAGFVVQNAPVKAVIRAIGPSLSAFGIANALADTTLQLRDVNGAIVRENDNWKTDQKAELENTSLQPTDDLEAALVETIPPGQYTAQVRGKSDSSGIGVVQVYFLQ